MDKAYMGALEYSGKFVEEACSSDCSTVYPITKCLFAGRSPFCEVVIAHTPNYGRALFLDKELQSTSTDEAIYHEHLVQPIMNSLVNRPRKDVLIVGGGEGATAREVLRWSAEAVTSVTWVDIDNLVVELSKQHLRYANASVYADPRLRYVCADIYEFLPACDTKFDVIILDLPDPDAESLTGSKAGTTESTESTSGPNLYDDAFFTMIRSSLKDGGGVVSHVGPVMPGPDEMACRSGLACVRDAAARTGIVPKGTTGYPYHCVIPSFQSDWGYWMSVPMNPNNNFPESCKVMDLTAQSVAFTWPRYYCA
jgi:spermidine synthase